MIYNTVLLGKSGIHIKKANRGKFTDYCGGKVTSECIARGKRSPNPTIRKRATFAANARKWKHENGGTIEMYQWGKIIPTAKKFFSPVTSKLKDFRTLSKSLRIQGPAEELTGDAYWKFWNGRPEVYGDIYGAAYFKDEMPLFKRVGNTVKTFNTNPKSYQSETFATKPEAIQALNQNMSDATRDYMSPNTYRTTTDVMRAIYAQAAGLKQGNRVALTRPEDLSIDSWPIYVKLMQRRVKQGEGFMEPVIDNGVYRMVKLNPYGRDGVKSLKRIDNIIKDWQQIDPNIPGRVSFGIELGPFHGTHYVPVPWYEEFKKGGTF